MARRGGPSRRRQGNVLGSVLRDLDRRTRSTTRRGGKSEPAPAVEGPRGPRGPRGPEGPPGGLPGAATVLVTGEDGRVRWDYPVPFDLAPILTAVAVDPDPDGATTVLVALEEVEAGYAVLRVWSTLPRRTPGVAAPAVAGVSVHVTACPVPG